MSRQRRVRPPRDRRPLAAAGTVAARTGASPDIGVPPPAAALEELEALYAQLPDLQCRGLCEHSCAGHVDASHLERARILQRGVDLDAPTPDGSCPALTRNLAGAGRCAVHPVRPTVCRLWGAVEAMPCPHGCRPAGGPANDAQALRWLLDALRIGGHRHTDGQSDGHSDALTQLIEHCMSDPDAAALMGRFLRGDRSVTAALQHRLALDSRTPQGSRPAAPPSA